jgi:hypothetical protein
MLILAVTSVWQIVRFGRYTNLAGGIRSEERDLRVESEALGQRMVELQARLDRPEAAAKLTEIGFLNALINRKSFSWTRVLASLERVAPLGESVHLVSFRPTITANGPVQMQIDLRGRSLTDITRLVDALEASSEFADVVMSVEQRVQPTPMSDVNVSLTVNYFPEKILP